MQTSDAHPPADDWHDSSEPHGFFFTAFRSLTLLCKWPQKGNCRGSRRVGAQIIENLRGYCSPDTHVLQQTTWCAPPYMYKRQQEALYIAAATLPLNQPKTWLGSSSQQPAPPHLETRLTRRWCNAITPWMHQAISPACVHMIVQSRSCVTVPFCRVILASRQLNEKQWQLPHIFSFSPRRSFCFILNSGQVECIAAQKLNTHHLH